MAKTKIREFTVTVRFTNLELGITLNAESLEQAIEKVRAMDTVKVLGEYDDYNNGKYVVNGVWEHP
jgi:hypothetical protein